MKPKEKEKPFAPSPPPTSQSPPEKVLYDNRIKRKNVLALNEKVAAIREYEKEPVYKRIGRMFHCSPDQIKRIVQQKEAILKAWEQRTRRSQDAKTLQMKVVRVSMLGKAVYDWIRRMMYYKDFIITDGLIQKMALQFKSAMGLQNFFPHQDWCDKFRQTYGLQETDSKLLNIGYTQGYSVQIKDVMKDVLSECTPEGQPDPNNVNHRENCKCRCKPADDDDCEDDDEDSDERMDENENLHDDDNEPDDKKPLLLKNGGVKKNVLRQLPKQLKPLTQLVALPIQTNNGNGSHKVLVATPISNNGQIRTSQPMTMTIIPLATFSQAQQQQQQQQVVIQQQQQQQQQQQNAAQGQSQSNSNSLPVPLLEIKQEIKEEPQDVYIKQECLSDFEDSDYKIEQEFESIPVKKPKLVLKPPVNYTPSVSTAPNSTTVTSVMSSKPSKTITTTSARPLVVTAVKPEALKIIGAKSENNSQATASNIDYDNLALASLRRLMQSTSTSSSETLSINAISTASTPHPTLSLSTTSTAYAVSTRIPTTSCITTLSSSGSAQAQTVVKNSTVMPVISAKQLSKIQATPLPQLQAQPQLAQSQSHSMQTPKLIPANTKIVRILQRSDGRYQQVLDHHTTIPATSTHSPSPTPPLPPLTRAPTALNSMAIRRKDDETTLPPIKSVSESRRYLKLLEEYALRIENFRLIGLITRADEVLREMDETKRDDEVDVD